MRPSISPSAEALIQVLREEKARGFSTRAIAARFGVKSESTVRDYLSGRRQPDAATAERAIAEYVKSQERPRLVLSREGLVEAEPLDRKSWSTLGKFDHAFGVAKKTGDWSHVQEVIGKNDTIRTDIGDVRLETRPDKLQEADDNSIYDGKDQKYHSPKKSKKKKAPAGWLKRMTL